jgi:hypothetical protein
MSFGLTKRVYNYVDTESVEVSTPDGYMYVFINTFEGKLVSIVITIGKSGSNLAAWCYAISQLMTSLIERGAVINDLIVLLSNITSDRSTYSGDRLVKSSIDGIVYALHKYNKFRGVHHSKIPNLRLPWVE